MLTTPKVECRKEQHYVAIRRKVAMTDIAATLPPLVPEVFAWLANHHIAPAGPCFFQYLFIDNNNEMIIEVGVPVQNSVAGDDRFIGGTFPAGHYVTIIYRGDYKNIMEGHLALEAWIRQSDWREQRQITDNGIEWGSRTEFYLTDPAADPNPEKWETEIAFLLADKAHA